MAPLFALFGSGEFLPWAGDVDRRLIDAGSAHAAGRRRVLVVPTACAPEGDSVFARWSAMGLDHYRGLGADPEALPLKVREDAERPEIVEAVPGAALIFFSGGNPAYLARTLTATAFWAAVQAAVQAGTVLAGSSAGISFLGPLTFDPAAAGSRAPRGQPGPRTWVEGIGLFPKALFGPHWDAVDRWRPGATTQMLQAVPEGCGFLGIDEDTAALGDGRSWELLGRGTATVVPPGGSPYRVPPGGRFQLDLGYAPAGASSPAPD